VAASLLGFVKVFIFAHILEPKLFGEYATCVSMASLLGLVISFGLMEDTIKKYPLMIENNLYKNIQLDIKKKSYLTMYRLLILVAVLVTPIYYFINQKLIIQALVAGYSFLTFQNSLLSSFIRSNEKSIPLGAFFLGKSFLLLLIPGLSVFLQNTELLLFSDIFVLLCVNLICLKYLKYICNKNNCKLSHDPELKNNKNLYVYYCFILTSFINFSDKGFISFFKGPDQTAFYSIVLIFSQIYQNVSNIVSQYFGPKVLKLIFYKKINAAKKIIYISTIAFFASCILMLIFGTNDKCLLLLNSLLKIKFSSLLITISVLIGFFSISSFYEFIIFAENNEKKLFYLYLFVSLIYVILFLTCGIQKTNIVYFLLTMVIIRMIVYLCSLFILKDFILKSTKINLL